MNVYKLIRKSVKYECRVDGVRLCGAKVKRAKVNLLELGRGCNGGPRTREAAEDAHLFEKVDAVVDPAAHPTSHWHHFQSHHLPSYSKVICCQPWYSKSRQTQPSSVAANEASIRRSRRGGASWRIVSALGKKRLFQFLDIIKFKNFYLGRVARDNQQSLQAAKL